jgi:hypothetical protein
MLIGKLNVGVSVFTTRTPGPNAVKRTLSTIYVRMGKEVIAERTIPGRWNEAQAMTEFKRFPDRFTKRPDYAALDLKSIAA